MTPQAIAAARAAEANTPEVAVAAASSDAKLPQAQPAVETAEIPATDSSLLLTRSAVVYAEPSKRSEKIGVVVSGTRVAAAGEMLGADCETTWVAMEPRGWVCTAYEVSEEAPSTEVLPHVAAGRLPGTQGRVRSSGVIYPNRAALKGGAGRKPAGDVVSLSATEEIDGVTYWRTQSGEYVAARFVDRYVGSDFEGVELGAQTGLTLPLAFAMSTKNRGADAVVVRAEPNSKAAKVGELSRRQPVNVLGYSEDGAFVLVGANEWVARAEVRLAGLSGLPTTDVLDERWLDVDLEEQVAVLYDGVVPVYATLISSGSAKHTTPTGVYRVARKKAKTTMRSEPGALEPYAVENVPWTLYFHMGYAVHGAFWHDNFGRVRSHGCVNLAPADARYIYTALGPAVPAGWNEVISDGEQPGALIRVRSKKDPSPSFREVARKMEDAHRAGQEVAQPKLAAR